MEHFVSSKIRPHKFDKLKIDFYKKAQNCYIKRALGKKNYYIFDSSKNSPDLEKKIYELTIKKLK